MRILAWPYWPRPPVCRTKRPSPCGLLLDRLAVGRPAAGRRWPRTLNSRNRRSTMISRCSSPIPEMIVCPVSWSVWHPERRVLLRQLAERRRRACPGRPWSSARSPRRSPARGTASPRARSACFGVQIVSPVATLRRPTTAHDVAGVDLLDLLALVGVHLEETADPLGVAGRGVEHLVAGRELPE